MKYFKVKMTLYVKVDDKENMVGVTNKIIDGLKTVGTADITADIDIETSGPRYRGKVLTPAQVDLILAAHKDGEGLLSVTGPSLRTASSLVKLGLVSFDQSAKGVQLTTSGTKLAKEMTS